VRARGFTLVEVLVALVIVAAGAAAVLSSLNSAAMSTIYLRDKTFAGWIADNRIAETRLQTTPPQNGTTEGELDYAGQRWRWRQQIGDAQVPGLRRIDVSVRPVVPGEAREAQAPATSPADGAPPGDWTITSSAVLGRDLAQPGMAPFDWEPPPTPGPGGGGGTGDGAGGTTQRGAAGGSGTGNGAAGSAGGGNGTGATGISEGPRT